MTVSEEAGGRRHDRSGRPPSITDVYRELRPLIFSIAYRMLSSASDAEDTAQEAFVRYHTAVDGGVVIESPKAYLSAVVTRISIDRLRSAAVRRERYVGQWLPEPLLTDAPEADPQELAELGDTLSMAFLLVLERLSPVERAVFLLHDVFGYGYDEIASIVHKSQANCRQLATRARRHVRAQKPRFEATREQRDQLADRFFAAFTDGNLDGLVAMLADDAVTYGDGGGKAPQWSTPIMGAERIARLFVAMSKQLSAHELSVQRHEVNGQPGAIVRNQRGELINVFTLDIADGQVQAVRSVINPDKLRHLGPVADLGAMRRQARSGSTDSAPPASS
jgi:RNA polymerase sigma-70 factor (ECF subfamily)